MATVPKAVPSRHRAEYVARINRVMDHIEAHLAERMELPELARVAGFSPYHFHRIFTAMVGETLNRFVQRLRVERAAGLLCGCPDRSVTEIALDCGFSSPEVFARAFRQLFGTTPTAWRAAGGRVRPADGAPERADGAAGPADRNLRTTDSKDGQAERNLRQDAARVTTYLDPIHNTPRWRIEMNAKQTLKADVRIEDLPEMELAYVRHVGPYAGDGALFERLWGTLMRWAGARGLIGPDTKMISVYHDDPNVTEPARLRTSVCIDVPPETEAQGEIGRMKLAGGRYALARFELGVDEYGAAWDAVCGGWLPESGYEPDDRPAFEWCHQAPDQHPEGKFVVDICVPVRPV